MKFLLKKVRSFIVFLLNRFIFLKYLYRYKIMFKIFKFLLFYYISWLIIIMYYEKNIIKFKIFEVDDIFEKCV